MKISESEMMKIYQDCSGHIPSILEELQEMEDTQKRKECEIWLDNIADYAKNIQDDYPRGKIIIDISTVGSTAREMDILNILASRQFAFVT